MGTARKIVAESHVAALNRVAATVRAEVVRRVRRQYPGFKAASIRAAMKITRATHTRQTAVIRVRGARTPIINFSARQTRQGVRVKIRQSKLIRGAFIATMPSGHRGVFWRSGKFGRRGNPKLERIEQLYSLSTPQAVELVLGGMSRFAEQRYQLELAREIKFRTARASGAA